MNSKMDRGQAEIQRLIDSKSLLEESNNYSPGNGSPRVPIIHSLKREPFLQLHNSAWSILNTHSRSQTTMKGP